MLVFNNRRERRHWIAKMDPGLFREWNKYAEKSSLMQEFTPAALMTEMLEKIPSFENKEILVLGSVEFYFYLKNLGNQGKISYESLTLLTDMKEYKNNPNVIYIPFEDMNKVSIPKKFDIIIGNPPYNSTSGGKKLWPLFSIYANRLLKENGNLLFVTPNTWLSRPHSPKMKAMVELCSNLSLHLIDTTASKYFPNIGEDIGYWMVSKTNRKRNTTVVLDDKTKEIDYVGQVIAMSESDELKNSITGKIRLSKSQNWHHRDYTMSHKIHIENNQLSEVRSEEFDTPVLQTASKVLYGRNLDVTQSWKLIINNSGYYSSKTKLDKYQKVTNEYGVGLGTYGLLVESEEQALNARSFFNSKAYRFVIEENKTSGFNTEVKYLPLLDVTKSWTDEEIYEHFNLTLEEVNLIESTVK